MRSIPPLFVLLSVLLAIASCNLSSDPKSKSTSHLLQGVTFIDGGGRAAQQNINVLVQADTIADIAQGNIKKNYASDPSVINMEDYTLMPLMVNAHGHLGLLKGTSISSENYTRANIVRQLKQYQDFGIGAVISLGADHDIVFGLRDSSQKGNLSGARLLTAGFGFGAPNGIPPAGGGFDKVYRPTSVREAIRQVKELAAHHPDFVKIWVDDGLGSLPKIKPGIYKAIIAEATRQHIPVAAHVYYLDDAKELIRSGIRVLAHSIRDKKVDEEFLRLMKENNVSYIPTLTRDYFLYIYSRHPDWLDDPFFRAALEPGVYDMLTSKDYISRVKNDPGLQQKINGYKMAVKNLKRVYEAGIHIAMGTDSGAQPVRAMGFSEHLELQLMHKAGIPIADVIRIATQNAAQTLGIDSTFGQLKIGKPANFIILNDNPMDSIRHTRDISEIWRNGKIVSRGPGK